MTEERIPVTESSTYFHRMVVRTSMGPLEARFSDQDRRVERSDSLVKEIQVKGLLPIDHARRVGFVTSIFDRTVDNYEPVGSSLNVFQEDGTVAYQHAVEVGRVEPRKGFAEWTKV